MIISCGEFGKHIPNNNYKGTVFRCIADSVGQAHSVIMDLLDPWIIHQLCHLQYHPYS